MKIKSNYKYLSVVSVLILFYFLFLRLIEGHTLAFGEGVLHFFGELITIPFILFLVFIFVYSIFKIVKKIDVKDYARLFSINVITILLLFI